MSINTLNQSNSIKEFQINWRTLSNNGKASLNSATISLRFRFHGNKNTSPFTGWTAKDTVWIIIRFKLKFC